MCPPFVQTHINACEGMCIAAGGGHLEHTYLNFLMKINFTLLTCLTFINKCASTTCCHTSENDYDRFTSVIGYRKTYISAFVIFIITFINHDFILYLGRFTHMFLNYFSCLS